MKLWCKYRVSSPIKETREQEENFKIGKCDDPNMRRSCCFTLRVSIAKEPWTLNNYWTTAISLRCDFTGDTSSLEHKPAHAYPVISKGKQP